MLEIKNVYKTFNPGTVNQKVALNDLNLTLEDGDFVTVIGGNGAGKSTMLNIIGGMDQLTTGTFTIDGQDYSHVDEKTLTMYRRHSVGFIFQAYNLMPTLLFVDIRGFTPLSEVLQPEQVVECDKEPAPGGENPALI